MFRIARRQVRTEKPDQALARLIRDPGQPLAKREVFVPRGGFTLFVQVAGDAAEYRLVLLDDRVQVLLGIEQVIEEQIPVLGEFFCLGFLSVVVI